MKTGRLFEAVKDEANRADPYPLYARLRETPVSRQDDGTYVASTHAAIASLLHDPRISSETLPPSERPRTGNPLSDWIVNPVKNHVTNTHRPFIFRDPPDHDTLRGAVMGQFTPQRVHAMRERSHVLVSELLDKQAGATRIDLVEDLAYPLPVTVICEMLGIPREDEPQFHGWATQLASALEPDNLGNAEARAANITTFDEISTYMAGLIKEKRRHPQDDMLSGLGGKAGPGMGEYDLIATAILLLVAGHETTVNLIANSMLALVRHPDILARLACEPDLAPRLIEEMLRYDPPVHFRTRRALNAIDIAGTTIPEGADIVLLLASGNRDPAVFEDPDRFDPDRPDIRHFGFGGGLHYCAGAPLARFEAEAALVALAQRLTHPRLVDDPPPYRPGAALRGPKHLRLAIDGIAPGR
ncbi:cytochrome P450 [Methylobacterium marchantiae]|uniref:Cytochrome P450 n=1 Tax=Methylobacterium marchantiae TaxID=600331 RepID=A0ABW3X2M6_9HYPH|nr:Cytochrome P450 107B1 [Methylobacterium marchantiae]